MACERIITQGLLIKMKEIHQTKEVKNSTGQNELQSIKMTIVSGASRSGSLSTLRAKLFSCPIYAESVDYYVFEIQDYKKGSALDL